MIHIFNHSISSTTLNVSTSQQNCDAKNPKKPYLSKYNEDVMRLRLSMGRNNSVPYEQ